MPTKCLVFYLFSFVYVFEVQRLRLQFVHSLTNNVRSIYKTGKTILYWATLFTTIEEKKFKKRNKIFICIVNIFVRRFSREILFLDFINEEDQNYCSSRGHSISGELNVTYTYFYNE